jgi:hypothetical protein
MIVIIIGLIAFALLSAGLVFAACVLASHLSHHERLQRRMRDCLPPTDESLSLFRQAVAELEREEAERWK